MAWWTFEGALDIWHGSRYTILFLKVSKISINNITSIFLNINLNHGNKWKGIRIYESIVSKIVFEVLERANWNKNSSTLREFDETWITDWSKNDSGTGAAFVNFNVTEKITEYEESIALGSYPTVFQAEVIAIERCARKIK